MTARLLCTALLTLGLGSIAQAQTSRPNFVFVLVDDFGWMDVGYNGSSFHETPRMDAFSK